MAALSRGCKPRIYSAQILLSYIYIFANFLDVIFLTCTVIAYSGIYIVGESLCNENCNENNRTPHALFFLNTKQCFIHFLIRSNYFCVLMRPLAPIR